VISCGGANRRLGGFGSPGDYATFKFPPTPRHDLAAPISPTPLTGPITAQRVDITLSDGRRILVEGPTALSAIVAMVEGLAQ